jgi:hypothetical protein
MMEAVKHMCPQIQSNKWPLIIAIDHHNLIEMKKVMISKMCHQSWLSELGNIDFRIGYIQGKLNVVVDG